MPKKALARKKKSTQVLKTFDPLPVKIEKDDTEFSEKSKGKRVAHDEESEKSFESGDFRFSGSVPEEEESSLPFALTTSFENQKWYDSRKTSKVMQPVRLEFKDFNYFGLEVKELLGVQKWLYLNEISTGYYEEAVRLFYANMDIDEELNLTTSVYGVLIKLNPMSWSNLFRLPVNIYETVEDKKDSLCSEPKEHYLKRALFETDFLTLEEERSIAYFPPLQKSLSYVITKFLLPKTGSATELSTAGAHLLWRIVARKPVNLGELMLMHLKRTKKEAKYNLCYPDYLTFVMLKHNVNLMKYGGEKTESVFLLDHKFLSGIGMSDETAEDSSDSVKEVSVPAAAKVEEEPLAREIKVLKDGLFERLDRLITMTEQMKAAIGSVVKTTTSATTPAAPSVGTEPAMPTFGPIVPFVSTSQTPAKPTSKTLTRSSSRKAK
jgi:hypothetical protein